MRVLPESRIGWGIYVMFVLGVLSWLASSLSAPEWLSWVLFVPFIVVGTWVVVGLWRDKE